MNDVIPDPKPGHPDAVKAGCACPRIDNHGGRGYYGDGKKYGWVVSADCPLHGKRAA